MNIDHDEVAKFDEMAPYWWDVNGPCKPLHQLNPFRLNYVKSCVDLDQKAILDVGCGGGILTESLSLFSPHVTGIDASEKAIDVARIHARTLNQAPTYECTTIESFASKHTESFDVLTCMELIEHVPSPSTLLQACAQLLKPNGHLIVSTLNRTPQSFLMAIVGAEYLLKMLPKGTHDYEKFIRPSEMIAWAKAHQLKVLSLKGIEYHPWQRTFSLSDTLSVNYLAHFVKQP